MSTVAPAPPAVRLDAAASTALDPVLRAAPRAATVLGVLEHAVYLQLDGATGVLAVLTSDAVRLPCALVLGSRRNQRPLTRFGPVPGSAVLVGAGCVRWTGPAGSIGIRVVRQWAPPTVRRVGLPPVDGLRALRRAVDGVDIGLADGQLAALTRSPAASVLDLLGYGPGLTPSGDDVLAGLLLGARAFGLPTPDVAGLAYLITAAAPRRTTALSAQLLRHAAVGECVPEVAAVIAGLGDTGARGAAIDGLLRLGHTSGAALGHGLLIAAELALPAAG